MARPKTTSIGDVIRPLPVKLALLRKLAAFMSDDVADTLIEIADDLRRYHTERKAA